MYPLHPLCVCVCVCVCVHCKVWNDIDRLSITWKSDLFDKIKQKFFPAVALSILLYGCTTWMLLICMEKKLDGNNAKMLHTVLKQHLPKQHLYGHLPPISQTISIRWSRHARHCWRSKNELIGDILLWTPTYGYTKVGQPIKTYLYQLCADTGCNLENLRRAMDDRDGCWERKRVRELYTVSTTW